MNDNYDKLFDDTYYKTVIYNTPNTVTNNSISNGYLVCDGDTLSLKADTYGKFLDSLDEVKYKKLLMTHTANYISLARKYFDGYLTEEELQEKQYSGRFWDINLGALFILVDDDTLVIVALNGAVGIYGRDCLPESLKGRHYYEDYRYT